MDAEDVPASPSSTAYDSDYDGNVVSVPSNRGAKKQRWSFHAFFAHLCCCTQSVKDRPVRHPTVIARVHEPDDLGDAMFVPGVDLDTDDFDVRSHRSNHPTYRDHAPMDTSRSHASTATARSQASQTKVRTVDLSMKNKGIYIATSFETASALDPPDVEPQKVRL